MATGTPFTPAPFATSTVAPKVVSALRAFPYISPSDYRFAPTAVSTAKLVQGSVTPAQDALASLANVIERASGWVDEIVFHGQPGGLAATVVTESAQVLPKPNGEIQLICNVKPVWEVVGLGVGPLPSQIANVSSNVAPDIWIEGRVIHVPSTWSTNATPTFIWPTGPNGTVFAVWSYVSGWPNLALSAEATVGATTIALSPPVPGGTTLPGIYAGTQLKINDQGNTETVVAASSPSGLVVSLVAPVKIDHKIAQAPDWIRVSALPRAIEQANIHLTSVLIKTQGTRAMVMAQNAGGAPSGQAIAEAGAMNDFGQALKLLKPYRSAFVRS